MKKILMLSLSYIKKAKSQSITFIFIMLLAGMMLNIGLVTLLDYSKGFANQCEELNTADLYFMIDEAEYQDDFYNYLKDSNEVTDIELLDTVTIAGTYEYTYNPFETNSVFFDMDTPSNMSQFNILEESDTLPENPIYVSNQLKLLSDYELGDTFTIENEDKTYSYTIAGFFDEMMNAVALNIGHVAFLLPHEDFVALQDFNNGEHMAKMINIQLENPKNAPAFIEKSIEYMSENKTLNSLAYSDSIAITMNKTTMVNMMGILLVAFSLIIVLVSLLVASFRIKNTIEEGMKNIGVLKAIGYSSNQIRLSFVLQFTVLTIIGCIIGIGVSFAVLPVVMDMIVLMNGISLEMSFNPIAIIITLLTISIFTMLISNIASSRVKKLTPVLAFRGGILTHSFKRNMFALDKGKSNVNIRLSLKTFSQSAKQNSMILLIVMAIFSLLIFVFVCYFNMVIEQDNFSNLPGAERNVATIVVNPDDKDILSDIQGEELVRKANYYDDGSQTLQIVQDDENVTSRVIILKDFSALESLNVYEGRMPLHDNEIMIRGLIAKTLGVSVGDSVTLSKENQTYEYLITGLTQDMNGVSSNVYITLDGYRRFDKDYEMNTITAYFENIDDIQEFLEYAEDEYSDRIFAMVNLEKTLLEQVEAMSGPVKPVLITIIVISLMVLALVLQLILKTNIIMRKTEIGILKSLGFTTGQIVMQTSLSIMPVFIIGCVVAGIISYFTINPLMSLALQSVGTMKLDFVIQPTMIIVAGIGFILFAFISSVLISLKLRKTTAYSLIVG